MSAVFGAVAGAGLVVEHLGEHPDGYWDAMPQLPDDVRRRLPVTFTLPARKPV